MSSSPRELRKVVYSHSITDSHGNPIAWVINKENETATFAKFSIQTASSSQSSGELSINPCFQILALWEYPSEFKSYLTQKDNCINLSLKPLKNMISWIELTEHQVRQTPRPRGEDTIVRGLSQEMAKKIKQSRPPLHKLTYKYFCYRLSPEQHRNITVNDQQSSERHQGRLAKTEKIRHKRLNQTIYFTPETVTTYYNTHKGSFECQLKQQLLAEVKALFSDCFQKLEFDADEWKKLNNEILPVLRDVIDTLFTSFEFLRAPIQFESMSGVDLTKATRTVENSQIIVEDFIFREKLARVSIILTNLSWYEDHLTHCAELQWLKEKVNHANLSDTYNKSIKQLTSTLFTIGNELRKNDYETSQRLIKVKNKREPLNDFIRLSELIRSIYPQDTQCNERQIMEMTNNLIDSIHSQTTKYHEDVSYSANKKDFTRKIPTITEDTKELYIQKSSEMYVSLKSTCESLTQNRDIKIEKKQTNLTSKFQKTVMREIFSVFSGQMEIAYRNYRTNSSKPSSSPKSSSTDSITHPRSKSSSKSKRRHSHSHTIFNTRKTRTASSSSSEVIEPVSTP